MTRTLVTVAACCLLACHSTPAPVERPPSAATRKAIPPPPTPADDASPVTKVEMHNVIVHEDATLQLHVRWLRGEILPAKRGVIPSFDDKASLFFNIEAGVMSANVNDISDLLNRKVFAYKGSPLSKVKLTTEGNQIKLSGTLHKAIPLPIEMLAELSATDEGRIRVHPVKLSALHLPVKGLLKGMGIHVGDLIDPKGAQGITVVGDDVILDMEQLMPPPRQRGKVSAVNIRGSDIVEVYGSPHAEVVQARQWKNFIACQGGALRFGKLTMNNADMTMIDTSPDDWFDFFLDHYQEQLRGGYIKLNSNAGLLVYMQDYSRLKLVKESK